MTDPADWPQPPDPPSADGTRGAPPRADGTVTVVGYAVAMAPILLAIVLTLLAPGFLAPFSDERISIVGVPAGFVLIGLISGLTAIGLVVARVFRSWWAIAVVVVVCVMPALLVLVFGPAIILIAINLGS